MDFNLLGWTLMVVVGLVALFIVEVVLLAVLLAWGDQKTLGLSYYGLPQAERDRFKTTLSRQATLLFPILRIIGRLSKFGFERASFHVNGIAGPKGMCTPESFEKGSRYEPRPEDIFVVTQMKCGTTWMQHLVYQVLLRGKGDLAETGRALYAVSPWLESVRSVSVDEAPMIGTERPSRIIKSHFPVSSCPWSDSAKYIYVVRHPVSCFASCVDFLGRNLGAFGPDVDQVEEWFCSESAMWWGSWPAHVAGWWDRSQRHDNVLFVRFEEMKSDLAGVAQRIAAFIGLELLDDEEMDQVLTKCGFEYMRENRGAFEMHTPHLIAIDAQHFVRGTEDRHRDVGDERRQRLMAWCVEQMKQSDFPMEQSYPAVLLSGP